MEDGAGDAAVAELVSEPGEVPGVGGPGGGGGFDFEGHDVVGGHFGEEVDLAPAVLLPEVVQPGPGGAACEFGPELGGDEGVEEPAEQIGGRYLVRGGALESLEGEWLPRIVLLEFDSLDAALAF